MIDMFDGGVGRPERVPRQHDPRLSIVGDDPITAVVRDGDGNGLVTNACDILAIAAERSYSRLSRGGHEASPDPTRTSSPADDRRRSEQEIATIRVAMPFLHFARAQLSAFAADHGLGHARRVQSLATQLGYLQDLTRVERHVLRIAALLHDIGNAVDRERHHIVSQEIVEDLAARGLLPFSPAEAAVIGLICRWHRRAFDPDRIDMLGEERLRTGLLASILRVADAMDIDYRRSDHDQAFKEIQRLFYPDEMSHRTGMEDILGVRIYAHDASDLTLQVHTRGLAVDNVQIAMLRRDVAATPLNWAVQELIASDCPPRAHTLAASHPRRECNGRTLLAFPFEPHSLIMAALSLRHLTEAGRAVVVLSYRDTAAGTARLWQDASPRMEGNDFDHLVVIGDRPDTTALPAVLHGARRWRASGARVSALNRHAENWTRLSHLRALGVEVTLGDDWAYFWGDAASRADLAWGRIAMVCARDPMLPVAGVTDEEEAVSRGLLSVVHEIVGPATGDVAVWSDLARPLLERIAADDRAFFARQALPRVAATYAAVSDYGRIDGRVLRLELGQDMVHRPGYEWLEAAIEARGRALARSIAFNVPYAVATWADGDAIEVVAITHWREEEAVPIRLLYPHDAPPPFGNERALRVRLSVDHADTVVRMLVDACNRSLEHGGG